MRGVILRAQRFLTSEDGPTAVEYAVLLGLITVGLVAAISGLASTMSGTFSSVSSTLGSGS
jgi:pilus assembly protein Flp/PilA